MQFEKHVCKKCHKNYFCSENSLLNECRSNRWLWKYFKTILRHANPVQDRFKALKWLEKKVGVQVVKWQKRLKLGLEEKKEDFAGILC